MKKFASITLAVLLAVSMLLTCVIPASAAGLDFTATGKIIMTKEATNDLDNGAQKPVSGATFTAYQVLTLNNDGDGDGTFTVTAPFDAVINQNDLTGSAKENSAGGLYTNTDEMENLIQSLEPYTKKATGYTFAETATAGTYEVDNLPLGVYLVVETTPPANYTVSTGSFLVTVPQWDGEAWDYVVGDDGQAVKPKDLKVVLDKKINGTEENDVYAIGDTVPYTVTTTLPDFGKIKSNDAANYDQLVNVTDSLTDAEKALMVIKFEDTMSAGLTFNKDLVISVGNYTFTSNDYKTYSDSDTGFVVELKWDSVEPYQGKDVTLKYFATLNKNAVVNEGSNKNTVKYTYTNNLLMDYVFPGDPDYPQPGDPNYPADPTQPVPVETPTETLEDTTNVYTFAMDLTKKFENMSAADSGLAAAQIQKVTFRVTDANGKYIAVDKIADGQYALNTAATVSAAGTEANVNVAADGTLYIKGFKDATYYLEEVATADGFSVIQTKVQLTLVEEDLLSATTNPGIGVNGTHYLTNTTTEDKLGETGRNTFEITINNVKK